MPGTWPARSRPGRRSTSARESRSSTSPVATRWSRAARDSARRGRRTARRRPAPAGAERARTQIGRQRGGRRREQAVGPEARRIARDQADHDVAAQQRRARHPLPRRATVVALRRDRAVDVDDEPPVGAPRRAARQRIDRDVDRLGGGDAAAFLRPRLRPRKADGPKLSDPPLADEPPEAQRAVGAERHAPRVRSTRHRSRPHRSTRSRTGTTPPPRRATGPRGRRRTRPRRGVR